MKKHIFRALSLRWGLILSLIILTSCEGFKVLSIVNQSEDEVRVIVKPSLGEYSRTAIANYPAYQVLDSSAVVLAPDSAMCVLSIFTFTMFNVKIKEEDLRLDYLRIESPKDTIIANSKAEIIGLIYGKAEPGYRSVGRNIVSLQLQ